jgi:quinol monooxygenase YgiN
MIIEQMSIAVPQGKRQELGSALASFVGPTQVEPGCLGCHLYRSWTDQDELRFETRWSNESDLIRHLKSDAYKKLLLLMELSSTPPEVEFFAVVEAQGLNLVHTVREHTE